MSAAAVLTLASCGSEINLGNAVAMVHGAIYYDGGPPGPDGKGTRRGPEAGTVRFIAANGTVAVTEHLGYFGYAVGLVPGRYTLRTVSGGADCRPVTIAAHQGTVVTLNVICDVE